MEGEQGRSDGPWPTRRGRASPARCRPPTFLVLERLVGHAALLYHSLTIKRCRKSQRASRGEPTVMHFDAQALAPRLASPPCDSSQQSARRAFVSSRSHSSASALVARRRRGVPGRPVRRGRGEVARRRATAASLQRSVTRVRAAAPSTASLHRTGRRRSLTVHRHVDVARGLTASW